MILPEFIAVKIFSVIGLCKFRWFAKLFMKPSLSIGIEKKIPHKNFIFSEQIIMNLENAWYNFNEMFVSGGLFITVNEKNWSWFTQYKYSTWFIHYDVTPSSKQV